MEPHETPLAAKSHRSQCYYFRRIFKNLIFIEIKVFKILILTCCGSPQAIFLIFLHPLCILSLFGDDFGSVFLQIILRCCCENLKILKVFVLKIKFKNNPERSQHERARGTSQVMYPNSLVIEGFYCSRFNIN